MKTQSSNCQGDSREHPPATVLLIGGTGRSGTNIAKAVLAQHPRVAFLPFEYRFILDPDGIIDFYRSYPNTWSPYLADRRLRRLERLLEDLSADGVFSRMIGAVVQLFHRRWLLFSPAKYFGWELNRHIPGFSQYASELLSELTEFCFRGSWVGTESYSLSPNMYYAGPMTRTELAPPLTRFVRKVVASILANQGGEVFVEDNTWNILFAPDIIELIPEAKFLHVYRNPMDTVASLTHQRWCSSSKIEAAVWYRDIMDTWLSIREDLPTDSYYELKLEDLVESTERVVQEICDFAGLDYDSQLIDIDLGQSNAGRWKRDFSTEEQTTVMSILDSIPERLGYGSD